MHMLYNSENFAVVLFDVEAGEPRVLRRGGYEIVDKQARLEIYIEGALAENFKQGVEDLIAGSPSEEDLDDYVSRYAAMAQQPVILH